MKKILFFTLLLITLIGCKSSDTVSFKPNQLPNAVIGQPYSEAIEISGVYLKKKIYLLNQKISD